MSSSFFDPFEARMQFLSLLKKLNASQQSIQKVVSFAIKYGSRCGEDLWDCVLEECEKGSLNSRINVLYFLDSLCETTLYAGGGPDAPYIDFVARDLDQITEFVVPPTREGVLNLLSAKQILETWRTKRMIRPDLVDKALEKLEERKAMTHTTSTNSKKRSSSTSHFETFSHSDTLRRMEEDRERHKRLRERIWVLPIPTSSSAARQPPFPHKTPNSDPSPSTPMSPVDSEGGKDTTAAGGEGVWGGGGGRPAGLLDGAVDLEFEQAWETTSDLNEDDLGGMEEENIMCFVPRTHRTSTRLPSPPLPLDFISTNIPPATPSHANGHSHAPLNPSLLHTPSANVPPRPQFQPPSLTVTNPTPTGVDSRSPQPQPHLPLVDGTPSRPPSTSFFSATQVPQATPFPSPSPLANQNQNQNFNQNQSRPPPPLPPSAYVPSPLAQQANGNALPFPPHQQQQQYQERPSSSSSSSFPNLPSRPQAPPPSSSFPPTWNNNNNNNNNISSNFSPFPYQQNQPLPPQFFPPPPPPPPQNFPGGGMLPNFQQPPFPPPGGFLPPNGGGGPGGFQFDPAMMMQILMQQQQQQQQQ